LRERSSLVAQRRDASELGAEPCLGGQAGYPVSVDGNFWNRPVRTRTPGGMTADSG